MTLAKYFFDKSKRFDTYASAFFSAVTKTDKTTEEGTCIGAETFAFIKKVFGKKTEWILLFTQDYLHTSITLLCLKNEILLFFCKNTSILCNTIVHRDIII